MIVLGVLVLCIVVSGLMILFTKPGPHNPNARHICACCGEPEETHSCNSC